MSRWLVTGGAGLVGSHLCERLLAKGDEVIAVDDLSTGSWANLAHLKRHTRFHFEEHDVSLQFHAQVDGVFHLALPPSMTASVAGTLHVLSVASANGAPLLMASSMAPTYAARVAETIALEVAETQGVRLRLVRSASAYGPRMSHEGLVARLLIQGLHGENLVPGVAADTSLDLAYAEDVAALLASAILEGGTAPTTTVAPWTEVTVGSVVAMVDALTNANGGEDPIVCCAHGDVTTAVATGVARTRDWLAQSILRKRTTDRPSGAYLRENVGGLRPRWEPDEPTRRIA